MIKTIFFRTPLKLIHFSTILIQHEGGNQCLLIKKLNPEQLGVNDLGGAYR